MNETDVLKKISLITGEKYAVVENGEVAELTGSINLTKEKLLYKKIPKKDGFYSVSEYTCDGYCSIDKPAQKCVDYGIYSPQKCALYSLRKVKKIEISCDNLFTLCETILKEKEDINE